MQGQVRVFARWAVWALPVWAALLVWGTLTHQPDPQGGFGAFAQYVITGQFLATHLVASILGAALSSVGVIALLLYLLEAPPVRRATIGTAASVMGNSITTAIFGVAAFAQPAMGRMFLAGQEYALALYNDVYGVPLFATAIVGLLLFIAGGLLIGSAIAASGRLPRWAGWAYAVATTTFVLSNFLLPLGQTPAALLLLAATITVAWRASL